MTERISQYVSSRKSTPRASALWVLIALLLVAGIGYIDNWTGHRVGFSIFYLAPISLATWKAGKGAGVIAAIPCAVSWFLADFSAGEAYSYPVWNTGIRLGFLLVIVFLLSRTRTVLDSEKRLARTDSLTGIRNRRAFLELLAMEVSRSERFNRPFSIAFIDCDNFKFVNDRFGHKEGDALLRTLADTLQQNVRKMDVIARFGGDEFAVLMPETLDGLAREVMSRVQNSLLEAMRRSNWPVTFSMGIATFLEPRHSADELIAEVDGLMYSAKNRGKNTIAQESYGNQ